MLLMTIQRTVSLQHLSANFTHSERMTFMRQAAAFLLLLTPGLLHADEARDIVERGMKARSANAETLDKQRCQIVSQVGKIVDTSGAELESTSEIKSNWPWLQRWETEMQMPDGKGKTRAVLTFQQDKAWMQNSMQPPVDMDLVFTDDFRTEIYGRWLGTLYPLKDKAFALTLMKDGRVGEQEVSVVKASLRLRPDVFLSFSKKDGHLLKVAYRASESGTEVRKEHLYSDYRDFDGLMLPKKQVDMKQVGNRPAARSAEWTNTYKFVDKFPPTTFEKPEMK